MPSKINTALHTSQLVKEFDIKGMMANLQLDETVVPVALIADLQEPQIQFGEFQAFRRAPKTAGERGVVGFGNATTLFRTIPSPGVRITGAWLTSELAGQASLILTTLLGSLNNPATTRGQAINPVGPPAANTLRQSGSVVSSGTRATGVPGIVVAVRQVAAATTVALPELVGIELEPAVTGVATPGIVASVDTPNNQLDLVLRWQEFTP